MMIRWRVCQGFNGGGQVVAIANSLLKAIIPHVMIFATDNSYAAAFCFYGLIEKRTGM